MTESTRPSALILAPLHLTLGAGALVVAAAAVPFWLPALLKPRAQAQPQAARAEATPAQRAQPTQRAQAAAPATPTATPELVGAA